MTEPKKGLTNESAMKDQPRNASRDVAPVSRVSVHNQELIEDAGLDPDTLDPDRHYRLVNARNPTVLRRRKRQGYEPVPIDGGVKTLIEPEDSPDGTIRFGDRILMSCPRELYEGRREKNYRFNETRLSNVQPTEQVKQTVRDLAERGARTHMRDDSSSQVEVVEEKK